MTLLSIMWCIQVYMYICVYCFLLRQGKLTAQGKLLLQDTLLVSEVTAAGVAKPRERRVFLFEQIIIFSEMIERKKGNFSNATYIFKNSLKVILLLEKNLYVKLKYM